MKYLCLLLFSLLYSSCKNVNKENFYTTTRNIVNENLKEDITNLFYVIKSYQNKYYLHEFAINSLDKSLKVDSVLNKYESSQNLKDSLLKLDSLILIDNNNHFAVKYLVENITSFKNDTALLRTNLLLIEKNILKKYLNKINIGCCFGFYSIEPILSQNSQVFAPNQELEITFGIGEFIRATNPVLTIDGKEYETNSQNAIRYKTKVGNNPGSYNKKIKISYLKPDGKIESIKKNISYTIK